MNSSAVQILLEAEALLDIRRLGPALVLFDYAEAAGEDPDRCAAGRWMVHMLTGDFASAWNESDAIRSRGAPDPHRFWQGEDLCGKRVIVRCLHGLGDTVQFVRYAPLLENMAASVIWEVPHALLDLALRFRAVRHVTTWEHERHRKWDVQLEVMELPYIFRTELPDLPLATNYLHLPHTSTRPSTKPQIGIVWSAGEWNLSRSIPLHLLLPVLSRNDCEFWNLQGGLVRDTWNDLDCPGLRDSPACNSGVASLAAVISHLDLIITVDTLAAHLAGALGIPAWVMLQYAADWRWMVGRADSPWYPSLRLFRQPSAGDWDSLVVSLNASLDHWLGITQGRLVA